MRGKVAGMEDFKCNSQKIKTKKGYCYINRFGLFFTDENTPFDFEKCAQKAPLEQIKPSDNPNEKLAKVTFFITSDCNLRCIYCYANSGVSHHVLSLENAKIFIDSIAKKVDKLILDFHGGGEPFLEFDLIKSIYEYAEKTGKLYRSIAITNGYFAKGRRKEIEEWIVTHINNLAISCDGTPEIQNRNRPTAAGTPSAKEVEETIRYIAHSNMNLTVRSTITRESTPYLVDIMKYFHSLGVKNIIFSPYYNYGRTTDTQLLIDPKEYAQNFMKAFEYAVKNDLNIRTTSFRVPGESYCGATSAFNMCLTPDGYISTCYEVVKNSNNPIEEPFLIGKIEDGKLVFNKKNLEMLRNVKNKKECTTCKYRMLCRGGCPIKIARNSEDSSKNLCILTKTMVPQILDYIQEHPESSKNILNNIDLYY